MRVSTLLTKSEPIISNPLLSSLRHPEFALPLVRTVGTFKFALFAASFAARSRSVHVAILKGFSFIKFAAIVVDLTVLDTKLAIYIIRERLLVKSTVSHG